MVIEVSSLEGYKDLAARENDGNASTEQAVARQ